MSGNQVCLKCLDCHGAVWAIREERGGDSFDLTARSLSPDYAFNRHAALSAFLDKAQLLRLWGIFVVII